MVSTHPIEVDPSNLAAFEAWDGADGDYWAEHEDTFERSLQAYDERFFAAAGIVAGDAVVDIGCGTGRTTRLAARRAVPGSALGIDLSSKMTERARRRAIEEGVANASFVQGDAQIYPFEPEAFDVALSRTGAMFFGEPISAFSNVARGLRAGGRLALLVWQSVDRNDWVVQWMSALAAGRQLPSPPPGAPGPFSLSDPHHAREVLSSAGFADVVVEAVEEPIWFGETAGDAYRFMAGMGFSQFLLRDLDEVTRAAALESLRAVIADHDSDHGVRFTSAAWLVTAVRA
jgi:SAM-dependent methyltransferase